VRWGSDYGWRVGTDFECVVLCCPPSGIPTLICWGLHSQRILRAMPAVVKLLAGSPVPDRPKADDPDEKDTPVLQVGVRRGTDNLTS